MTELDFNSMSWTKLLDCGKDSIVILKNSESDPLISKAYNVQGNRSYLLELTVNKKDLTFITQYSF